MDLNRFPRQTSMAQSRVEPHFTDLDHSVYDTQNQMIDVIPKLTNPSLPHASPVTPFENVMGDFGYTVNNFAEKPSAFRSPKQNPTDSTCAFNKTASTNTITPSNLEVCSPILRLPNFHEALRADEEKSSKNATAKLEQMITQFAPITVKSTINDRSQRLLNLISTTVGPCASKDFPFNVPKLEEQALRYLKMTNDQITA